MSIMAQIAELVRVEYSRISSATVCEMLQGEFYYSADPYVFDIEAAFAEVEAKTGQPVSEKDKAWYRGWVNEQARFDYD